MSRFPRAVAGLVVVVLLAVVAAVAPAAGPPLLGLTALGVIAAAHEEHIRC